MVKLSVMIFVFGISARQRPEASHRTALNLAGFSIATPSTSCDQRLHMMTLNFADRVFLSHGSSNNDWCSTMLDRKVLKLIYFCPRQDIILMNPQKLILLLFCLKRMQKLQPKSVLS